jgi:hypothetical protein
MGQADINSWRRQNSDPVSVVLALIDGTTMRGTLLQPRDKSLRELFNMPEPFFDIDSMDHGPMVLAKSSIASIRLHQMPAADQLDRKVKILDKSDPYAILGVGKAAQRDEIHAAYIALARTYHPDRFAATDLPAEIADYIATMARRINAAYAELAPLVKVVD